MNTWRLEIEYDGTRYYGWRIQHDSKTIQGELVRVARDLFSAKLEIGAAEATDPGAHAYRQIAHLKVSELKEDVKPGQIMEGFNELLPYDINILKVQNTADDFHAGHDAKARQYLYKISRRRSAFSKNFVWWVKESLNTKKMQSAAKMLVGRHDFTSFGFSDEEAYPKKQELSVKKAEIFEEDDLICFRILADEFLPKMVRVIVGKIAEVGCGNIADTAFERILRFPSDTPRKFAAPAAGLFLEKVFY
ncbi:MAG: tRNA pseudouridine(38-40) synthase TruA [Pyrinomonadaceae bacterium]|nr:tRNA pseudouridine(38-40) synthase TruA [Pyrinomonadaceae bacterium]